MAFCTIQNHFIRDIRAKFGIYNSPQSSDTEQNSDGYNSRTSDDIDMKLGSVTKLNKRNKTTWKKVGQDVILTHCDVFVIFPVNWSNPEARFQWKPDSRPKSVKSTFSLTATFYLTNTENRTKKFVTQLSHCCFEKRYHFSQNMMISRKKYWHEQN